MRAPADTWKPPPGTELATWRLRLAAYAIDWALLANGTIAVSLVLFVTIGLTSDVADSVIPGWLLGATFVTATLPPTLLYAPLLMMRRGRHNGQTLGKQWLGLRVVADDGAAMSFGRALVRDGLFKAWLSGLTLMLDFLWPLWDRERRALHDRAVRTHVVRVGAAPQGAAWSPSRPEGLLAATPAPGRLWWRRAPAVLTAVLGVALIAGLSTLAILETEDDFGFEPATYGAGFPPVVEPTADHDRLLAMLPGAVEDCVPLAGGGGSVADIICSVDRFEAYFALYDDHATMVDYYEPGENLGPEALRADGGCSDGQWHGDGTWGARAGRDPRGRVKCSEDFEGNSFVEWTDNERLVYGSIYASGVERQGAYDAWRQASGGDESMLEDLLADPS